MGSVAYLSLYSLFLIVSTCILYVLLLLIFYSCVVVDFYIFLQKFLWSLVTVIIFYIYITHVTSFLESKIRLNYR